MMATPRPALAAAQAPEARGAADQLVLGGALISTALLAGLYYGWVVSVLPGLARTDDATFVSSMQEMNEAIVNPAFMLPANLSHAVNVEIPSL